jgi:hypothetical protein
VALTARPDTNMGEVIVVAAARSLRLLVRFAVLATAMGGMLFALGAMGESRFPAGAQSNHVNPAADVHLSEGCPAVGQISSDLETRRAHEVVNELTRSSWFRRSVLHDLTHRWVENSTVVAYSPCHPDRPTDTHSGAPGVAVVVDPSRAYRVVFINVP